MATILEKMQVADIKLVGGLAGSWPAAVGDAGDRISGGWVTGNALQRYERNHVDHSSFHDRRHRYHGAAPNAGAAACRAALSLRPCGLQHQRQAHRRVGCLYLIMAERRGVPCPGLCDAADRYARRDV